MGAGTDEAVVGAAIGGGVGDGAANGAAPPSAMTARSTFFMAKFVDNGCPVGGVIHDGGAVINDGAGAAGVGAAGATGVGSEASSEASRWAPQVTQVLVPGSL